MIIEDPFLIAIASTTAIILVVLTLVKSPVMYRVAVAILLMGSVILWYTTPPEEGVENFYTADTIRILGATHRAITNWKEESGAYPPAGHEGLAELHTYSRGAFLKDAWNQELKYDIIKGQPKLTSAGADGEFGTDDDIIK